MINEEELGEYIKEYVDAEIGENFAEDLLRNHKYKKVIIEKFAEEMARIFKRRYNTSNYTKHHKEAINKVAENLFNRTIEMLAKEKVQEIDQDVEEEIEKVFNKKIERKIESKIQEKIEEKKHLIEKEVWKLAEKEAEKAKNKALNDLKKDLQKLKR